MGTKGFVRAIVTCASVISTALMAGGSTGGGNVVICKDPMTGVQSTRLLDYYEAEILMPDLVLDLGKGTTVGEKVEHVLHRLEAHDRSRADSYRAIAKDFLANTRFVTKVSLPDIKDHDYVPLEAHCRIEQIAVQKLSPFPEAKKYTVRKEYWDQLSVDDRAGLVLHEVIYEGALALGHKNSRNTRYFNALVSSQKLKDFDAATYSDRLALVGLTAGGSPATGAPAWTNVQKVVGTEVGQPFRFDLNQLVIDPGSRTLTFKKLSGPAWLSVSASGIATGTPGPADLGSVELAVEASNGTASASGEAFFQVTMRSSGPRDTVVLKNAYTNTRYEEDLNDYSEIDSCPEMTFRLAPEWVPKNVPWYRLQSNGVVTGMPRAGQSGNHQFNVIVECGGIEEKTYPVQIRVYEPF